MPAKQPLNRTIEFARLLIGVTGDFTVGQRHHAARVDRHGKATIRYAEQARTVAALALGAAAAYAAWLATGRLALGHQLDAAAVAAACVVFAYGVHAHWRIGIERARAQKDAVEKELAQAALQESKQMLEAVIDSVPQRIFWKDVNSHYLGGNRAFAQDAAIEHRDAIAGLTDDDMPWHSTAAEARRRDRELVESGKPLHYEELVPTARGELRWLHTSKAPIRSADGTVIGVLGSYEDVTELVQSRELLNRQANVDSLTMLPNRNRFTARLEQAIRDAQTSGTRVALVFMDIDHFKDVNDSLGHGVGDRLLQEIGARLSASTEPTDTVARYGGDEFVIIVLESGVDDRLSEVLARVSQTFAQPVVVDDSEFHVETSIGIACFPSDGADAETLLRRADLAMNRAKSNGRNGVQRFTAELGRQADQRLALSRRMRVALANGEFRLAYQPQVDVRTNRVTGVEALLRWDDSELGPVSPATFIPIAEENGLIVAIGEWVMQQACFQAQTWQATLPGLRMSVNLSPRQFARGDIVRVVQRALSRAQLSPQLLEVEITESALLNLGSLDVLRALRAMDIDIAIDDFGTGYSSLSYLRRFRAERLQLDMSFVRGIGVHREDEVITRAILSLGRALGFSVVAEGVETDMQLAFLRRHGCSVVQGYRFARPMPAAQAHAFIQRFNQGVLALE